MMPRKICQFLLTFGGAFALAAPASAVDDVEIRKVNCTDLTFERVQRTQDPMISFERRYLLHGAIDGAEQRERRGKYYNVHWRAKNTAPGIIVRFEYLQAFTGSEIHVQEVKVEKVERTNSTDFQVTGRQYSGEWVWPDGTPLTDQEYDVYLLKLRARQPIDVKATAKNGGDVVAWKVSLLRDGVVLATEKSYLWRE